MKGNLYIPKKNQRTDRQVKPAWYPLVRVLALLIAFCTVFSLIPPSAVMAASNQSLDCSVVVHHHDATCYGVDNVLMCGTADFVVHTHNSSCYAADSSLVCQLPVTMAHTHSDECYETTQTQICELEADETHAHGDGCFESVQMLVCPLNEIALHSHSNSCRSGNGNLICGVLEVVEHIHNDSCFTTASTDTTEPPVETTTEITSDATEKIESTEVTESLLAPIATAEVANGSCGESVNWVLTEDGVLTISGSGNMTKYSSSSKVPWYSNCSLIKSVVIESGVTSIGDYAFYYCNNLENITIPEGITLIGNNAFYYCNTLTSIIIPGSVTSIGASAFSSCSNLTSITIPDSVTSIGAWAFSSCSNLTSITIPDSVISIGAWAFSSCSNLTSITIPDSVTSIEEGAFSGCSNLANVTLSNSITSIGYATFDSCKKLTSITIPNGVTSIADSAFYKCSSLTTITIPESVISIGNHAFYDCSSLTNITIPDNVTSIGNYAFYSCDELTNITVPYGVTSIGDSAFFYCAKLERIILPNSITSIGDSAFSNCSSLTTITIPESVTSIGNSAFSNCRSLAEIKVDTGNQKYCSVDGVLYTKDKTTLLCYPTSKTDFTEVTVPEGITTIADSAFYNCSSLTTITIPESVISIGNYAFYDCSSLTNITIPDNVTSIGNYAFYSCDELTNITVPYGVTSIGDFTFSNCSSLTTITLPESITSIGDSTFRNCSSLTTITIPESITSIGDSAFSSCAELAWIILPNSITSIGEGAFSRSGLTSIVLPASIASIKARTFYDCAKLTSITLENGQLSLGSEAFYRCSQLTSITFGKSADTITSSVLNALGKYSDGITDISFDVPNYFYYSGNDYTAGTLILTEGHYYADNNSVLYRLSNDNIATLFYCPKDLEQYEILSSIPAEDGSQPYAVTAIGNSALEDCRNLKDIRIPDSITIIGQHAFQNCTSLTEITLPGSITQLGAFAFYDCKKLSSINEETTLSAVVQAWADTGADISTFQNTALSGSSDILTEDSIMVETGVRRTVAISTSVRQALTGERVLTTLSISTDDAGRSDVIRVYFLFSNKYGSLDYAVGPKDFDGILGEVCKASIPYTYYIEFKAMSAEQELSLDIPYGYQKASPGGTALVWVDIMTEADAQALGNSITAPIAAHQVVWGTQPDAFQITQTPANIVTIQGDGTAEGAVTVRDLQYNINVNRTGSPADNGQDPMVRIDYIATLSLPEHFSWRSGLLDAISKNDCYVVTEPSASPRYSYYVKIGQTSHLLASISFVLRFDTHDAKLTVDDAGNIQIHWTLVIPNDQANLTEYNASVTFGDDVIIADVAKLSQEVAAKNSPVDCAFINSVSVTQHFAYSTKQTQQTTSTKVFPVDTADCTIGSSMSDTYVTMGERTLLTITLSNTDVLPHANLDYVSSQLPDYFYITPSDMEAMFRNNNYGKDLRITITNATLCTPFSRTVIGTDGNTHVITQQYEGTGTSYNSKAPTGSESAINSNAVLTIGWAEDKTRLMLTNGAESYEISPGSLQSALASMGYVVTSPATYTCTWDQVDQILYSGENRTFQLPITAKSTFMRLNGDMDQYITSKSTYTNYVRVYTNIYDRSGSVASAYSSINAIYRDFTLANDVFLNGTPIAEATLVKAGDVLTYHSTATRHDGCSFNNIPLVSNLEGAQLLLVSAEDNPSLAGNDLETLEVDGATFYVLNKAGQYSSINVGGYLTDRVEIQATDNGVDTMIYWYLADSSGDTTITTKYQTLISPDLADVVIEGETYTLTNEVWLNDHQAYRLYDHSLLYATVLSGIGLDIVTNLSAEEAGNLTGHNPSKDVLAAHSFVSGGQTVTYRLMLDTGVSGSHAIYGSSMFDALPASLDNYWSKDNITVTYIPAEGSSVEIENGDSWYIEADRDVPSQQYLRWNDNFSAIISGTLYIYVTLTYPAGTQWSDYCHAYGSTVQNNAFHVYNFQEDVSHQLFAQAEVLLQKDIQNIGLTNQYSYYFNPPQNSLWYYLNDAQYTGLVTYSITLYNGGDTRIYLSEIQDVLPEGFTFYGLCDKLTNASIGGIHNNSGYYSNVVSISDDDHQKVTFKQAYISADSTTNASGQQVVTFCLSNSGYGNLEYDEQLDKYYLNAGEAVVIAYHCQTNRYSDTKDAATSTASMLFFDYTGAGVHIDTDAVVDRKNTGGKESNNGNRLLFTTKQEDLGHMVADSTSSSVVRIASEVTVYRGSIQPGISKIVADPYAYVADPVTWSIQVSNSGTDDMRGYTVTDVMMKPYQFIGTVSYRVDYDYSDLLYTYCDNLFTFTDRTDEKVTISYGYNNSKTAVLTINGDYQQITAITTTNNSSSSSVAVTIWVKLSQDSDGNEVLSIFFPEDSARANIPAGGRATLSLQTQNFSGIYRNTSFFNTAYITPSTAQFFDSSEVSQGNYTIYDGADSVASESSVAVSYGYYTPSNVAVAELSNPSNFAASGTGNNLIVLDSIATPFRYSLTVNNTGGTASSKAMDLLVLINNLPQIGDNATLYPDIPRFSAFQVNFDEAPAFSVSVNDTILDPSTYTLQFTTATTFSTTDWNGMNDSGWYTLDTIRASSALSLQNMRSFRVVIRDDTGVLIPGDSQITVSFNAKIDPNRGNILPFSIAWNSFGYLYSLVGNAAELSANSQNVGVRTASAPCLTKELQNSDGTPSPAKVDTTFRFVIYNGAAITLPDVYTQEYLFNALANTPFTIVELTVQTGKSTSAPIALNTLYCYCYENGNLVKSDIPWIWKNAGSYTLLELPPSSESIYQFDSFNNTNHNNYIFVYDSSFIQSFTCLNVCHHWDLNVQKLCHKTEKPLAGTVFGLYSPVAVDLISDEQYEEQTANLLTLPQKVLQLNDTNWYLMDIQITDDDGCIQWSGLVEKQYYLLELQATYGYLLNDQPGQIIQAVVGETATITVTNTPCLPLPKTGGLGTNALYAVGAVLTTLSLLVMDYRKKQQSKNK